MVVRIPPFTVKIAMDEMCPDAIGGFLLERNADLCIVHRP